MRRHLALLAFIAAALCLSACEPISERSTEPCACGDSGAPEKVDLAGDWGSREPGEPWLSLGPNGKLAGNDGCNRLSGSWESNAQYVDFGAMASTKMYCEGVDTWLSGAATAGVQEDTMTLKDAQGKVIGTLQRAQ